MINYTQKIEELKAQNKKNETEKIKLEERLKNLKEEKNNLLAELIDYDINNVSTLDAKIEVLEKEIEDDLNKIEGTE